MCKVHPSHLQTDICGLLSSNNCSLSVDESVFPLKHGESCKRWENPIKKLLFATFPDHLSAVFFSLHKEVKEIAFPSISPQVTAEGGMIVPPGAAEHWR